jgi:hypothetical protein
MRRYGQPKNSARFCSKRVFGQRHKQRHPLPRQRRNTALQLRRADRIAPHEYRLAALRVIETAVGIDREDLIVETARLLGFDRTGNDLHAAIDKQITALLKSSRIHSESGHIRLALDSPRAAD